MAIGLSSYNGEMRERTRVGSFVLAWVCAAALAAIACGGGDDDVDYMPGIDSAVGGGSIDANSCGAAELCMRSIDGCEAELTQQSCEAWYADDNNCSDMAAYTMCNCECITRATCDQYFACGEVCFADHCN